MVRTERPFGLGARVVSAYLDHDPTPYALEAEHPTARLGAPLRGPRPVTLRTGA